MHEYYDIMCILNDSMQLQSKSLLIPCTLTISSERLINWDKSPVLLWSNIAKDSATLTKSISIVATYNHACTNLKGLIIASEPKPSTLNLQNKSAWKDWVRGYDDKVYS